MARGNGHSSPGGASGLACSNFVAFSTVIFSEQLALQLVYGLQIIFYCLIGSSRLSLFDFLDDPAPADE